VVCFFAGCSPGDDNGVVPAPAPGTPTRQQAVNNLLSLYQQALQNEDSDRLQTLLQPDAVPAQSTDLQTLQERLAGAFRSRTFTAVQILEASLETSDDLERITFLEAESSVNLQELTQQTRLFRTTLRLTQDVQEGVITLRIRSLQRSAPLLQVLMRGRVQAGALARVEVTGSGGPFTLTAAEVEVDGTGVWQALVAHGSGFHGLVTVPMRATPRPLAIRLHGREGQILVVPHQYRSHVPGQGVVHKIEGTGEARFFTVAVARDHTVWAGGNEPLIDAPALRSGVLYRVDPGSQSARRQGYLPTSPHATQPEGRVEASTVDALGRLHFLFIDRDLANRTIVGNGVLVHDPQYEDMFCQTVDVFAAPTTYPFRTCRLETGQPASGVSTRLVAAEGGDIWLFGSDCGVTRVADNFRKGVCPATAEGGVQVTYNPVFRRQDSGLLSNTVPALVPSADDTLWFGTAFGLTRRRNGNFTNFPFDPVVSLQGRVATLEEFFQRLAQAIFDAQPVSAVTFGEVSFLEEYGSALVKADLIFSAAEDDRGRLWAGTLGGGLRRLADDAPPLHLTRQNHGLVSDIIIALAVAPDGLLWAATPEGVSQIQESNGTPTMTNFTALDGLGLPVRGIASGAGRTLWLATEQGLFRIIPQGARVQGVVRDLQGQPVAGADVTIVGSPLRAVADTAGRFMLADVPPGEHHVHLDGLLATRGAFTAALRTVEIGRQDRTLAPVILVARTTGVAVDPVAGGSVTFPAVPGAVLDIAAGALQVPTGATPTLSLTLLPRAALPVAIPRGFTLGAAADLQPDGVTLTTPARLTLPNQEQLPAGQVVVLLRLNENSLRYEQIGFGRVSNDGTVITTISGGLTRLSTVVFASTPDLDQAMLVALAGTGQVGVVGQPLARALVVAVHDRMGRGIAGVPVAFTVTEGNGMVEPTATQVTDAQGQASARLTLGTRAGQNRVTVTAPGLSAVTFLALGRPDRDSARLLQVSGNNQVVDAGAVLPEPLVIRLEDQFGNRLPGERVRAELLQGTAIFLEAPERTDDQGEARFRLQAGTDTEAIVVQVSALGQQVQFLAFIGFSLPFGVAVEADGNLVVVDATLAAVIRVNPATGVRTIVSAARLGAGFMVGTGPFFEALRDIIVAPNGDLLIVDTGLLSPPRVLRVHPISGDRTIVSDAGMGSGPPFVRPVSIAQTPNGQLVVTDFGDGIPMVFHVDPTTGRRTLVPDASAGTVLLLSPVGIAVEASGTLVVVDDVLSVVIRIDPTNNNRTLVSGGDVGDGAPLLTPISITVAADGTLLVLLSGESGFPAVLQVDPVTGFRQVLSGVDLFSAAPLGIGPSFGFPTDLAVEASGSVVVVDAATGGTGGGSAVLRVDPLTGDRSIVSEGVRVGRGPSLVNPIGVAVETNGSLVVVEGFLGHNAVLRVDPGSGDRRIVSDSGTGSGPLFFSPLTLAVEATGRLVVVDNARAAVIGVNPTTGDRAIVSGAEVGSGPPFGNCLSSIAVEPEGTLAVLEAFPPRIVRVDPTTGDRMIVSAADVGSGPLFENPFSIAVEAAGALVVVDGFDPVFGGRRAVLRVNPRTGERLVVSDDTTGSGPRFEAPTGLAIAANGSLLVTDGGVVDSVVRVHPVSGRRTLVSGGFDNAVGQGPAFLDPVTIAVEPGGTLVVVDGLAGLKALLRVNPVTGERAILAK
jgi:streptogramin lyase